jgi:hypothetical protein
MARTGKPVLTWTQLRKGQTVVFYTADGWKRASVASVTDHSCSVTWTIGSTTKTTNVYDTRNLRIPE